MEVNRQEFLGSLQAARAGLASKDRVEQASSFVFSDGNLVTYNEAIMVIAPCKELEGVTGAIRAEELLAVLNKLTAEKITLNIGDGQMVIKSGRSKSGIRFEEEVRIPVEDVLAYHEENAQEQAIPKGLLAAFIRAKFCVARSLNNIILTGIHFNGGLVTSTDNYRIFQTKVKKAKLPEFLIPATAIDALVPYKPTHIAITDKWAFFRNEADILFCVHLIERIGNSELFPDVSANLKVDGPELVLPLGIIEGLDKADIFTKAADHDSDRFVEISIKSGRVTVRGEGPFGWHEETVKAAEYTGEPLTFASHPDFLRDIIPQVQVATLGERTVCFSGEDFVHVFVQSTLNQSQDD